MIKKQDTKDDTKLDIVFRQLDSIFGQFNQRLCSKCTQGSWLRKRRKGTSKRGCCVDCASNDGYFSDYESQLGQEFGKKLDKFKKDNKFDEVYGFFNKRKKECRLKREQRSKKCACYCCIYYLEREANKKFNSIIDIKRKRKELI